MDIEEAIRLKEVNRQLEAAKDKKWAEHEKTDKREKMIDDYIAAHGELPQDQLQKIRKMYDTYEEEGKEFKIDYIQLIVDYDKQRQEKKLRRIELDER